MNLKIFISSILLTLLRILIIPYNQNPDRHAYLNRYESSYLSNIFGNISADEGYCQYTSNYFNYLNKLEGICNLEIENLIIIFSYYLFYFCCFMVVNRVIFYTIKKYSKVESQKIFQIEASVLLSMIMPSIIIINGYLYDDIFAVYLSLYAALINSLVVSAILTLVLYSMDHGTSIIILLYYSYRSIFDIYIRSNILLIKKIIFILLLLSIAFFHVEILHFLFNNKYEEVFSVINSQNFNDHGYLERMLYFFGTSFLMLNSGQKNSSFLVVIFLILIFIIYKYKINLKFALKIIFFISIIVFIIPTHAYVKYYVFIYPIVIYSFMQKLKLNDIYLFLMTINLFNFLFYLIDYL